MFVFLLSYPVGCISTTLNVFLVSLCRQVLLKYDFLVAHFVDMKSGSDTLRVFDSQDSSYSSKYLHISDPATNTSLCSRHFALSLMFSQTFFVFHGRSTPFSRGLCMYFGKVQRGKTSASIKMEGNILKTVGDILLNHILWYILTLRMLISIIQFFPFPGD